MKRKNLLISKLSILHLLLLFLCLPAAAGELKHPLHINAQISNGGYLKDNSSIPVTVEIKNNGDDFRGTLSLEYERSYKASADLYFQEISIPRNGQKRFFLYVPECQYIPPTINIKVTRKGDFLENRINLRRTNYGDLVFLVLNRQKGGMAYLSGFKSLVANNAAVNVSYPEPAQLPIFWKGLDSADVILINDYPSLNLDSPQEKAILNYVRSGGCLVISTNLDPNEYNGSLIGNILPLKPQNSVSYDAGSDHSVFRENNTLIMQGQKTGETIFEYNSYPLISGISLGKGCIYYITADLSKKPFNETFEENVLWKKILTDKQSRMVSSSNMNLDESVIMSPHLTSIRLDIIMWLMFIYLILVGPVNYNYLKKKDQLMKLFITVPAIALIFSLIIFLFGYSAKGSALINQSASVVSISNGTPGAMVDTAMSIFSPSNYNYDIKLTDPESTGWLMQSRNYEKSMKIRESDNIEILNQNIPMWSSQVYRMQRAMETSGPCTINVKSNPSGFYGTITNDSGFTMKDCVLLNNGLLSQKFDLPPGISQIQLSLHSDSNHSIRALASNLNRLYGIEPSQFKTLHKEERFIATVKYNLINRLFQMNPNGLRDNTTTLIGWNYDEVNPVTLNRRGARKASVNIFIVR